MASAPIKFRCFRCNQLLGVSRSKAGAVVACPKCRIDLVVPQPQPEDGPPSLPNASSSAGAGDGGISLDVLNIRPEDIRVEPGSRPVSAPSPSPAPVSALMELPQAGHSVDELMTVVESAWPVAEVPPVPTRIEVPIAAPPAVSPVFRQRHAVVPRHSEESPALPGIQIETPSVSSGSRSSASQARSRDLILPRSVVASWSLLVLFGLVFAFMAGLLAGHYVWRVH